MRGKTSKKKCRPFFGAILCCAPKILLQAQTRTAIIACTVKESGRESTKEISPATSHTEFGIVQRPKARNLRV